MFNLSKRKFFKAKQAALAVLASVASLGASGAVAAATTGVVASPQRQLVAVPEAQPKTSGIVRRLQDIGPGTHRFRQRDLTGLEIRAVRTAKRAVATNRMARSKYTPDGTPCRITKALTFAISA